MSADAIEPAGQRDNVVVRWFAAGFDQLHPLLQALHRHGAVLGGQVEFQFGKGLARMLGRHMARKLGLPDGPGRYRLHVEIGHDAHTLRWSRYFNNRHAVISSFRPCGQWPDGHWIERTGPLELALKVDIIGGGWHWRVVGARLRDISVPLALIPRSTAYKRIEDGKYRFYVDFSLPVLGKVLSYSGLLDPVVHG